MGSSDEPDAIGGLRSGSGMAPQDNSAALPSGFVTFVFTDIEGSTRLLKKLQEGAMAVFDRHRAILHQAWRTHGGHEIDREGDSFFVAFSDTASAMAACVLGQRLLAEEVWPPGGAVKVRMGIHAGLAVPRGDHYVALAVHQAARVVSAGHGGQIILTEAAAQRVPAPAGGRLVSLGRFRVRDFDEPERLYRLDPTGLNPDTRSVRATPAEGHNLIRPPTSILGREADVAAILPLLGPGRTLSLTGPGGVGKTRLAIELGFSVASQWADGVWMVDLADLADSTLVPEAVAEAVGASVSDASRCWDDVIETMRERNSLIILDNVEPHITACARLVPDLMARCGDLGLVCTGREPLNIPGETVYRVRALGLPSVAESDPATIVQSPAVQLFLDRSEAARPGFRLDQDSAHAVAGICIRLDGLPLAIEIAAARVTVLSPAEILQGLDDRFRLLRSPDRTLPQRHRTLEGLLEWSDRLLEREARAALRRLALFGGAFSVDAAIAAVAEADLDPDVVPELIWTLVDKSLVVADLGVSATRYRLQESVREYGLQRLREAGETLRTATRLGTWFLTRVGPWRMTEPGWIGEAGIELANLRALVGHLADAEPELAQQLACTIGRYHDAVQTFSTGIEEVGRFVSDLQTPTAARVALLTELAGLHLRRAEVASSRELLDAAAALQEEVGAPEWDDAVVDRTRGEVALRTGNLDQAVAIADAALARGLSTRGQGRMWNLLGIAHYQRSDTDGAADAFERELETYSKLGYEANMAGAHGNLAEAALRRGDVESGARHQQACLELALALGQPVSVAYSCIVAARLAGERGEWPVAVRLHSAADAMVAETGHALYDADRDLVEESMGEARAALGETALAAEWEIGRNLGTVEAAALASEVLSSASGAEHEA